MLGRICSNVSAFCGNAINSIPQAVRQTVHETAVETATVSFSAAAANMSQATFMASMAANFVGAVGGVYYAHERARDPSIRLSRLEKAVNLFVATLCASSCAAAALRVFPWKKMNHAKTMFVFANFLTTAQLTADSVTVDGVRPGARIEEIDPLERRRSFEWGVGATAGSLVAGIVAAPMGLGIGSGIAAGVVTMKAARYVARAIANRVRI